MEQLEQAHLARIQAEQTCLARITAVDTAARTKEMRQSGSHIDWGKARVEVLAVAGTGPATEKQVSRDNVPPTSAIANTTPTSVDTISDAVQQEEHHNPEMRRNSKEEIAPLKKKEKKRAVLACILCPAMIKKQSPER